MDKAKFLRKKDKAKILRKKRVESERFFDKKEMDFLTPQRVSPS